ncbi:MAG: hypothetical protein ACI8O8_000387 [Oleiphilaceae bacterium]|jgi:hypothetical protein
MFIMKTSEVFKRINQVIKNLPYLKDVLHPLDSEAPWSELNPSNYESKRHFSSAVRSSILPIYAPFREVPHLPYEVPEHGQVIDDNEAWFFLNGICTDRSVLRLNGKALADIFQRKIYLMHNPSDGIFLDLLECAAGLTLQPVSTLETSVASILEEALNSHSKVILIAHSQGGIIATGALYTLAKNLGAKKSKLLKKLEVYTFASAATEQKLPDVYSEHFCHTGDYVARIGVAGNQKDFSGRIFNYDASGHLLNAHYLKNLTENKFIALDGRVSRLVERIQKMPHTTLKLAAITKL